MPLKLFPDGSIKNQPFLQDQKGLSIEDKVYQAVAECKWGVGMDHKKYGFFFPEPFTPQAVDILEEKGFLHWSFRGPNQPCNLPDFNLPDHLDLNQRTKEKLILTYLSSQHTEFIFSNVGLFEYPLVTLLDGELKRFGINLDPGKHPKDIQVTKKLIDVYCERFSLSDTSRSRLYTFQGLTNS